MAKRAEDSKPRPLRVILSVRGGVADILLKPRGIEVVVFDYDVDGDDDPCLAEDPDGHPCRLVEWPSDQRLVENEHWPIVAQAVGSVGQAIIHTWQCPGCGRRIEQSYAALAEVGTPICPGCDEEMELI